MSRRLDELDALRGVALGMMLLSNFVSDLDFFGAMEVTAGSGWWWKRAADQGNLSAQLTLALRYDNGAGVAQDQAEAVRWYQRAAEQGHVAAQIILGGRYANGRGVEKDDTVAVEWYRMAAEQGNIRAQYSLGVMYETGQGVSQDNVQAYLWYDLGAVRPSVEQEQSIKNRDRVASQMTPEEVAEARRLVREWRGANEP